MKKIEFFKIEGDRINRLRKHCPKCGPGVFLADHKNRLSCGKCGYTEFKGGGKPAAPKEEQIEKPVEGVSEPPKEVQEEKPIEQPPIEKSSDTETIKEETVEDPAPTDEPINDETSTEDTQKSEDGEKKPEEKKQEESK